MHLFNVYIMYFRFNLIMLTYQKVTVTGCTTFSCYTFWQCSYTFDRFNERIYY